MINDDPHPNFPDFTRTEIANNPILRCFNPNLPPHLKEVSDVFVRAAVFVVRTLPNNAERATALRKLREAKDCAITAIVVDQGMVEDGKRQGFTMWVEGDSIEWRDHTGKLRMKTGRW